MAWNESTLWMISPDWAPSTEVDEGGPAIISFWKVRDGPGRISMTEFAGWLGSCGFAQAEAGWGEWANGTVKVLLENYNDDEELSSIRLRFVIFDPHERRLFVRDLYPSWRKFVSEVAERWGLKLVDVERGGLMEAEKLSELLSKTPACDGFDFSSVTGG